jgi:hypothetical protein
MPDPYAQFEISRIRDFNPDTGPSYVLTFAGTVNEMDEVAAYYEEAGSGAPIGYGYKTTFTRTASGGCILVVRIPDEILYITRWDLESCTKPVPIWWLNSVREYIQTDGVPDFPIFNGGDGTQTQLDVDRQWLRRIGYYQNAVSLMKSGQDPTTVLEGLGVTFDYMDWNIIYLMLREGEYTDWKQPILKRNRTVPVGLFENRIRITGLPELYSLDGIANNFGLDDNVYDQATTVYDDLPTAPPNTMWAWRTNRDDSATLIGSGKVQECKDWLFGRWSTILNDFVE